MKPKMLAGIAVIVAGIILSAVNFVEANVEYGDFATAEKVGKKIQVKGEWDQDNESYFDAENVKFIFYLKDDNGRVEKIELDGAKPNNFELATSVVAKGTFEGDHFHATEVLTKCPSKYEGDAESVQNSL